MLSRLKAAIVALLLATALVPQAPQPAHAFFGLCFWWCPPSAASLIEQRPNLKRQPAATRSQIEKTIETFRSQGGEEADLLRFLEELDKFYSRTMQLNHYRADIRDRIVLASSTTIGQKAAEACLNSRNLYVCGAAVILGGMVYMSEQSNRAGEKTAGKTIADTTGKPIILFHYTNAAGLSGILASKVINASQPPEAGGRDTDARHGPGQYFTDIPPGSRKHGSLAFVIFGTARAHTRVTHFLAVDVNGLSIKNPLTNVFVHNTTNPLPIGNRIHASGPNVEGALQ